MSERGLAESLQDLGLTEYQSKAYIAAVTLGTARPRDLVEESGVPQARIYDVIDDLHELGLVEIQERSGGKQVSAPRPETVLQELRHRKVDRLTETVNSAVSGLERLYSSEGQEEGFVSMVDLRESALRHIRRTIESAEWWLSLALPMDVYDDVETEIADALDRGVTVRLVVPDSDDIDVRSTEFPEALVVRQRALADTMAVADRHYGVSSSDSAEGESQPYIVTQQMNLVFLFQNFYEQFWMASATVQPGRGFPRRYLDPWRAIKEIRPELDAGADLIAEVTGYHNHEEYSGTWEGPIVNYELSGPVEADYTIALPVSAALFLDVDGERVEVGGRKATVAHIAADGLEIRRA